MSIVKHRIFEHDRSSYAIAMVAFGVLSFLFSDYVSGLQPVSDSLPLKSFWVYSTAVFLVVTGVCLLAGRYVPQAALALCAMFLVWLALIQLPILISTPRSGTAWVRMAETLALAGASMALAGMALPAHRYARPLIGIGRYCFGVALPVFAATHFIWADFVADLIPQWIPARLFWAWFTGFAHLLAGLAIVFNVKARLAATLAGIMYGSWALILHAPRVANDPGNQGEWTSLFVAIALCGSAWLIGSSFRRREKPAL